MRLTNLHIAGEEGVFDLTTSGEQIVGVRPYPTPAVVSPGPVGISPAPTGEDALTLSLPGALAFPGMINSHDHLDFNLFPPLGNKVYTNYTEWGRDIHLRNKDQINAVLKVPLALRTAWGIYKNLLNGFTTVVNHGDPLATSDELITVFQECQCLHSVGFEKNWRWKLNRRRTAYQPVVLHVGEGTNPPARREIDRLLRWNLFKKPLIGIHGVAMNERQAAGFRALVWCPASNYFLLERTAPIGRLKEQVPVAFGTDSTLTAGWNGWEQIRLARDEAMATDRELLQMLTETPATVWGMTNRGKIAAGLRADLVVAQPALPAAPSIGPFHLDDLYRLNPGDFLLVLHKGQIRLFDASLLSDLTAQGQSTASFSKISIGGKEKYVWGDLPGLMIEIRKLYPEVVFPEGISV